MECRGTSPAAIGALAQTIQRAAPDDGDGGIPNEPHGDSRRGRGSFDDGNYDLSPFLASGSRHAAFLASWWRDAQSYASGTVGQAPSSGAFAKDVEQAGFSCPQHALTTASAARAALIDSLPPGSRGLRSLEADDRFSKANMLT